MVVRSGEEKLGKDRRSVALTVSLIVDLDICSRFFLNIEMEKSKSSMAKS
jgi:hypothetical protein